jgi:8-amino-7-oxononanoate synthase
MRWAEWAKQEQQRLSERGVLRADRSVATAAGRISFAGQSLLNFAGNDYLNLASNPLLLESAAQELTNSGLATTSSRLMSGTRDVHRRLEERLCRFLGSEEGLYFSSGYLCNLGVISGASGRDDVVLSDRLIHASLLDGIALSRAEHRRFRHNDVEHAERLLQELRNRHPKKQIFIVTESVFSMDGDEAPLMELQRAALEYNATLIVDEAHAVGVFGPCGRGKAAALGLPQGEMLLTLTLSKALGSYGGFAAGPTPLRAILMSRARSFIFNTSAPPIFAAAAVCALDMLERNGSLGAELLRRAAVFRGELQKAGFDTAQSSSHIVPILVPGAERAMEFSARLRERGLFVPAIRTPTVPPNGERLRFSLTLALEEEELRAAADIIRATALDLRIIEP